MLTTGISLSLVMRVCGKTTSPLLLFFLACFAPFFCHPTTEKKSENREKRGGGRQIISGDSTAAMEGGGWRQCCRWWVSSGGGFLQVGAFRFGQLAGVESNFFFCNVKREVSDHFKRKLIFYDK